jgi:hypothetical protein
MTEQRVYRQLQESMPNAETPAQDSILRLALGLMAADIRADLTVAQRQWVLERLWPKWQPEEKARVKDTLLEYLRQYRPTIVEIVARQFDGEAYDAPTE